MVGMSHLKFQFQNAGGKPQIFFGQDQPKNPRKFSYKNRDQRYPLREKVPIEEPKPTKPAGRPGGAGAKPAPGPAQKRLPVAASKKTPSGGGTVTLTQEQLELILSSVGKTAASERDNSVRISVERTDGGLNIEAQTSPRHRGRGGHRRGYRDSDDDEDSALGETADTGGSNDEDDRRPVVRKKEAPPPARPGRGAVGGKGGENVMGLLSKAGAGPGQAKKQPIRKQPMEDKGKPAQRQTEVKGRKGQPPAPKHAAGGKKEPMSEEDIDRKMQRIIAENKDKMSESELVDLLAAVYLEERKQQLIAGGSAGDEDDGDRRRGGRRDTRDEGDRRRYEDEDEEDGYRRSSQMRRKPAADDDREDEKRRRRPPEKKTEVRRRRDGDDDSDEGDKKGGRRDAPRHARFKGAGADYDDDDSPRRRRQKAARRRDFSDDDDDRLVLGDSSDDDRRRPGRKQDTRRQRRASDSEDDDRDYRRTRPQKQSVDKDRTRRGRRSSGNEDEAKASEKEEAEKPRLEAPRFLTVSEKKRLQWEKEREELKNLKTYDPWGRPGAGAPPKEDPSTPILSKKEEEQQRYARELAEQLKEKRELESRDRAHHDSGGGNVPSGNLMNVDGAGLQLSGSFARGRGMANLDEKTRTQLEEQRRRQVEHQEAIKMQVEERQAKRAQERERRIREEQEEEARLQRERDRLQKQFDDEQSRNRRREVEHEARVAQLQAANEAAEQAARVEKARRRMERLEGAGHDTSALRANFEAELTARSYAGAPGPSAPMNVPGLSRPAEVQMATYTRAAAVPGLEGIAEVSDNAYSARWATPRQVHIQASAERDFAPAREDHQIQTDASLLQPLLQQAMELAAAASTAHAQEQPIRRRQPTQHAHAGTQRPDQHSARAPRGPPQQQRFEHGFVVAQEKRPPAGRGGPPVPINARPKWGNANPRGRRVLKQSEREVGEDKRVDREARRARREAELMAKVEANQRRIPRGRGPPRRVAEASTPGPNWTVDEGPVYLGTYELNPGVPEPDFGPADDGATSAGGRTRRAVVPSQRTGRLSPPVPALRRGGAHPGAVGMSRSEENLVAAVKNADVGLVRTSEVLNPARAERPLPISREDTERQLARRTYLKSLNPAHYGDYMANLDDHRMEQGLPSKTTNAKNPIFNPGIVKDMPTPRQDAILQHLSDIRKNLLQKQREIETSLSITENVA